MRRCSLRLAMDQFRPAPTTWTDAMAAGLSDSGELRTVPGAAAMAPRPASTPNGRLNRWWWTSGWACRQPTFGALAETRFGRGDPADVAPRRFNIRQPPTKVYDADRSAFRSNPKSAFTPPDGAGLRFSGGSGHCARTRSTPTVAARHGAAALRSLAEVRCRTPSACKGLRSNASDGRTRGLSHRHVRGSSAGALA